MAASADRVHAEAPMRPTASPAISEMAQLLLALISQVRRACVSHVPRNGQDPQNLELPLPKTWWERLMGGARSRGARVLGMGRLVRLVTAPA
jgi:hypothetical protein